MAYHTTIFEDARKDHSKRYGVPGPTIGSVVYGLPPQYFSIPLDASPRSRPFRAFEDSLPTPPPDPGAIRPQRRRRARPQSVRREHGGARQRELYLTPGVAMTAEMRTWNGRRALDDGQPSILASAPAIMMFVLAVLASAARAEMVRRRWAAGAGAGGLHVRAGGTTTCSKYGGRWPSSWGSSSRGSSLSR
ncbi:hypothetical protein CIB48_g9135 [Xylaria polymorpha]|nr:hypothetical protein CIB48_g9135 [Xylaria polymorpha]